MVVHEEVSLRNRQWMKGYADHLKDMSKGPIPAHIHPSTANDIYKFLSIKEACKHGSSEVPMDVTE